MAIDGECDCGGADCPVCSAGNESVDLGSEDTGSEDIVLEDDTSDEGSGL
ncbi:MAG: hypothetical protein QF815_00675 [Candidatus Peribacteraceae bacterium]|nr:hypothetical protein [Candidatus Peribacteraceae bacterium]